MYISIKILTIEPQLRNVYFNEALRSIIETTNRYINL